MNWHKVGKNIRRATGGLSSKIFGAMKTTESPHLKAPKGTELVGNACRHEQTEKNLRELEFARARAPSEQATVFSGCPTARIFEDHEREFELQKSRAIAQFSSRQTFLK